MSEFKKDDRGKDPLAYLPTRSLRVVSRVLGFGVAKYGRDNWRHGSPDRYVSAALRHIFAYMEGERVDPDTGESHLAHAMCCILFILEMSLEKAPPQNPGDGHG